MLKQDDIKGMDKAVLLTILVAALGYFVDIFDLLLFSIVRVQSLKDLGISGDGLLSTGIFLINTQMAGLLIGGILWGVLGDRMGRVSVLLGSILLYSIANILNGFVTDVNQYAALRFIAGIGLAGELGAGITLASELLPKKIRGLGTTFIAATGVLGAMFAAFVADIADWRTAYIVGGVMGLCLLVMRVRMCESGFFEKTCRTEGVSRGNFLILLTRWNLLKKYIAIILVGAPIWCTVGIFITFTPEFSRDFGMVGPLPTAGQAVFYSYLGLAFGDMFSGFLSQHLRSRRKSVILFLGFLAAATALFVMGPHTSLTTYYTLCFIIGMASGYWAMFIQIGAEQFGTNIRATAATSIPNFVRALTIPMTAGFHALIPHMGITASGVTVMAIALTLALVSILSLKETFHADLDYLED